MHELTIVSAVLGVAVLISNWLGAGHHQEQQRQHEAAIQAADADLTRCESWGKYRDFQPY
jgi:hypothetical protein